MQNEDIYLIIFFFLDFKRIHLWKKVQVQNHINHQLATRLTCISSEQEKYNPKTSPQYMKCEKYGRGRGSQLSHTIRAKGQWEHRISMGNSLCAIKKDRNALCVPGKVQRSLASLLQLFCALHATAVSLGSNAVKLQVWKVENTLKSKYVINFFWVS